jgi:hypothetical protein
MPEISRSLLKLCAAPNVTLLRHRAVVGPMPTAVGTRGRRSVRHGSIAHPATRTAPTWLTAPWAEWPATARTRHPSSEPADGRIDAVGTDGVRTVDGRQHHVEAVGRAPPGERGGDVGTVTLGTHGGRERAVDVEVHRRREDRVAIERPPRDAQPARHRGDVVDVADPEAGARGCAPYCDCMARRMALAQVLRRPGERYHRCGRATRRSTRAASPATRAQHHGTDMRGERWPGNENRRSTDLRWLTRA